ncbi:MAG: hypothetical protein HIU90_10490 [Proteobacteria bacterium]|nr:hypothetical protein [Pseudomonadota bacterium]
MTILRIFMRDKRGLSTLEFALVAPLLLLLCFAIVAYCIYFFELESLRLVTAYQARDEAISCETGVMVSHPEITGLFRGATFTPASPVCPATAVDGTVTVTVTGTYPFSLMIPFIATQSGTMTAATSIKFVKYN